VPVQGITKFDSSKEDSATYSSIRRAFQICTSYIKKLQTARYPILRSKLHIPIFRP